MTAKFPSTTIIPSRNKPSALLLGAAMTHYESQVATGDLDSYHPSEGFSHRLLLKTVHLYFQQNSLQNVLNSSLCCVELTMVIIASVRPRCCYCCGGRPFFFFTIAQNWIAVSNYSLFACHDRVAMTVKGDQDGGTARSVRCVALTNSL